MDEIITKILSCSIISLINGFAITKTKNLIVKVIKIFKNKVINND